MSWMVELKNIYRDNAMFHSSFCCRVHFIKVLLLIIFLCGLTWYFLTPKDPSEIVKECYFHNGRNPNGTGKPITYFEDLLTSGKQPQYDRGIFFVETQCSDSGIADLKPRFACSIEAAAKANPTRDVFMIFSSPVGLLRHDEDWSSTIKVLMEYPNVHFRNVQLQRLCVDTPLEKWIETSALFKSLWPYVHASDVIRVLLVYRYGGTYLDMDYTMLRRLDAVKSNWIAIQEQNCLNNAAFDFRRSGIGHTVLNEVLSDLAEDYKPDSWDHNGPHNFERVLKKICDVSDLSKVDQCHGIKIYPPKMFYPLFGPESFKLFNKDLTAEVFNQTKYMVGFHYYNSDTRRIEEIEMGDGTAYDVFAQEFCPRIYDEHDIF